jgi:hypothetical protein
VFAGHSLGGGLAEFGFNSFGPQSGRIPLPQCNYVCFSFNSPGTDSKLDSDFMKFGRKNAKLLKGLNQQWKIHYQFEYGDIFPQGGSTHLGTTGYDPQKDDWLDIKIDVFKPKEKAESLSITTQYTHGRRIGFGTPDKDYTIQEIKPNQLFDFNHSWWLNADLEDIFGTWLIQSPEGFELARRIVSILARPFLILAEYIYNFIYPLPVKRQADGILCAQYQERNIQQLEFAYA